MVRPTLISWIRHPRMAAWFLLVAVAWIVVRIPFARVYFLASVAEFSPAFLLAPMAGWFAGPAGVAGIVAGTLMGDLILGQWGEMTIFRVLGYGLSAGYMMALSYPLQLPLTSDERLRIGVLLIPMCLTAAAWIAAGGALRRLYPFAYLLGLNTAQFLVFTALFTPALLHFASRHWFPHFGTWHRVLGLTDTLPTVPPRGRWMILAGAPAACAVGALLSGLLYGVWPIGRSWLGLHTGAWVTTPVLFFLSLQIAGIVLWIRKTASPSTPNDARFDRMYLPPLEKR